MTVRIGFSTLLALVLVAPVALVAQSQAPQQAPVWKPAPELPADDSPADAPTSNAPAAKEPEATAPAVPAPLIERARSAAFQFSQKLPNFLCQEYMARYVQRGEEKQPLDIVQAEVVYNDGQESYRNVKVDGKTTDKGMMETSGSRSTGEFASMLLDLFSSNTNAQFQAGGRTVISGSIAQVYDFTVRQENSHWQVESESKKIRPAYKGSVWVDPSTAQVLRIEMEATDIPPDFPMDRIETAVDYAYTSIAGNSSLLPVHAETLGCGRDKPDCSHNIIDFRNYHQFKATAKIQ